MDVQQKYYKAQNIYERRIANLLGACPRMKSLLRKIHFGHIWCKFSLNRTTIRLKFTPNLPQNGFPSLRLPFSDSLLELKKSILQKAFAGEL